MAVCRIYDVPGGTLEQYDAVNDRLRDAGAPGPDEPPEGAVLHVAGAVDGGFRVIEVWESRDHIERFMQEHLGGALQEVQVPQPSITEFELHNVMWGR